MPSGVKSFLGAVEDSGRPTRVQAFTEVTMRLPYCIVKSGMLYFDMPKIHTGLLILCGVVFCACVARGDEFLVYRGKVVMEDGSPPGSLVTVQRTCQGYQ